MRYYQKAFLLFGILCVLGGRSEALDDLILEGPVTDVYLEGDHAYREVRITKGANPKIHLTNSGLIGAAKIRCETFVLDEQSVIDGLGQEFILNTPGEGWVAQDGSGGNGGSYGGFGGRPAPNYGGKVFGSDKGLDIAPGGTGGRGSTTISTRGVPVLGGFGGPAGASISIEATSCVILGKILMNGAEGFPSDPCPPRDGCSGPWGGGGGSGGGIFIVAKDIHISAHAILSASGGRGGDSVNNTPGRVLTGYGGGGGRIKIFYESGTIAQSAKFNVAPGRDTLFPPPEYIPAQPGIIWIEKVPSVDQLLHPSADFNNDGVVDATDALFLIDQWHKVEPTLTPTLLPTPTLTVTPAP